MWGRQGGGEGLRKREGMMKTKINAHQGNGESSNQRKGGGGENGGVNVNRKLKELWGKGCSENV